MRYFFTGLILFAAAVGLAVSMTFNPGNVVFFYPPYRIDLSLNLFGLLAALFFILLYFIIGVLRTALQMPERVAEYRRRLREKRAQKALRSALQAYFEGRFGHAEKQAELAQDLPDTSILAALIAARSAHRMNEYGRRDDWLRRAENSEGAEALRGARLMTEAECRVDARDGEKAIEVVDQLHSAGARHIHSLRLSLKAHQYAGNWEEVLRLLRLLNKRDAVHPLAARKIKALAYGALLDARGGDGYSLIRLWQTVPAGDRRQPDIALAAARAFNRAKLGYQARTVLEDGLAYEWDNRLVLEYAEAREDAQEANIAQIERVEKWLAEKPGDASVLLTLGMLCARANLWGKATSSFEAALIHQNDTALAARIHLELARVLEIIDREADAAEHYRRAALDAMSDA